MKMSFDDYFKKHSKSDTNFLNRISALEVLDHVYNKLVLKLFNLCIFVKYLFYKIIYINILIHIQLTSDYLWNQEA